MKHSIQDDNNSSDSDEKNDVGVRKRTPVDLAAPLIHDPHHDDDSDGSSCDEETPEETKEKIKTVKFRHEAKVL